MLPVTPDASVSSRRKLRCLQVSCSARPHTPTASSIGRGGRGASRLGPHAAPLIAVSWGQRLSLSKAQGLDKTVPQAPVALTSMILDTE